MVKVEADRDVCIGSGNCVMTTDRVFDQDDEALVVLLTEDVPEGEEERVRQAVKLCPSQALRVVEE